MSSDHAHSHSDSPQESFSQSVLEVSKAEEQAKARVENARKHASESVAQARQKAAEMLEKAETEGKETEEAIIGKARAEIESQNAEVISQAKRNAAEFKKKPFKQLASELAREFLPSH